MSALVLGTVVTHCFSSVSSFNVSFVSQTPVGSSQAWLGVTVGYKMQCTSVLTLDVALLP